MSKLFLFMLIIIICSCGKNAYLSKKDNTKGVLAVVVDDNSNPDDSSSDDGAGDDSSGNDSSGDDSSGDDSSEDDTSDNDGTGSSEMICEQSSIKVLEALSGSWTSGCQSYVSGHSLVTSVTADETGNFKIDYQLYKGNNCSAKEAYVAYKYKIEPKGCLGDSGLLKVDLISEWTKFSPDSNNYTRYLQRISECEFSNWQRGFVYDLTGTRCDFLLSTDPFHNTYRRAGEIVYSVLKLKVEDNYLHLADWTVSSGDSEEQRINETKETAEYILRKI